MPQIPDPTQRSSSQSGRLDASASEIAKQIAAGARQASSPEDFGELSERLRVLADLFKPIDTSPIVKGELDPSRDAAIVLPSDRVQRSMISSIAFDARGVKIAVMMQSGDLEVYSATEKDESGQAVLLYKSRIKGFRTCDRIEFTPVGDEIVLRAVRANDHNALKVVSITGYGWFGRPKVSLDHSEEYSVMSYAVSPEGSHIALACSDGKVRLLDGSRGMRHARVSSEIAELSAPVSLQFSRDGARLFFVDNVRLGEAGLYVADVLPSRSGAPALEVTSVGRLCRLADPVKPIVVSPDLERVALIRFGTIEIHALQEVLDASGKREISLSPLCNLQVEGAPFSSTFSRDGRMLAFVDPSGRVSVHDLAPLDHGEAPVEIAYYSSPKWVSSLRFSVDGGAIAVGSQAGTVTTLSLCRR